jgi:hypothetical protein
VHQSVTLAPLRTNGTNLAVLDNFGIFYSADNGVTWTAGTNVPGGANSLAVSQTGTFLTGAANVGVRRSTDGGASWVNATTQPEFNLAGALVRGPGGAVFGLGAFGLIRSTDDGDTWQSFESELPPGDRLALFRAHSGFLMQTKEVVDNVNVYRVWSSGEGATWQDISAGLPVHWVTSATVAGNETWVSTPVGIYKLEP